VQAFRFSFDGDGVDEVYDWIIEGTRGVNIQQLMKVA
jgi:hypothetical protein